MSGRLAPGARRLAGLTCRLLAWRPDEFWAATPAEVLAILCPEPPAAGRPLTRNEMNALVERDHDKFQSQDNDRLGGRRGR